MTEIAKGTASRKAREDLTEVKGTHREVLPEGNDRATTPIVVRDQIGPNEATGVPSARGRIGVTGKRFELPAVYAPTTLRPIHTGRKMATT